MKQIKIAILLIIACATLCACPENEDGHHYITFVNKSHMPIACQIALCNTNSDTLYHCQKFASLIPSDSSLIFESSVRSSGWETELSNDYYLRFLIMDTEEYNQYRKKSCDTIRKYVPILHRYQLKLEDLQRMNWTVVYPR